MIYCLDSSAIIDGWIRHYPPEVFPSVEAQVETLVVSGRIVISDEVVRELEKKDDRAKAWAKARKSIHVPLEEEIQDAAAQILAKYPRLVDTRKNRSMADPFVIATAQVKGACVVSDEAATNKPAKPNIPDVCLGVGVPCITFLEILKQERWTF